VQRRRLRIRAPSHASRNHDWALSRTNVDETDEFQSQSGLLWQVGGSRLQGRLRWVSRPIQEDGACCEGLGLLRSRHYFIGQRFVRESRSARTAPRYHYLVALTRSGALIAMKKATAKTHKGSSMPTRTDGT